MAQDADVFEANRARLLALGYRMLGDIARAEDVVQDAWLRWQKRDPRIEVDSPKAFLLTTVTRLCLDELGSARARREESRSDRLPEPVALEETGLEQAVLLDEISMAFLVLLQRLTPAERAVLLLHDVFDMSHAEIAATLGRTEAACRQLLRRARDNVAEEKRAFQASPDEHRRLLGAFVRAVNQGKPEDLAALLAEDAVMIADAGPDGGRFGRIRNIGRPLVGRRRIVAFLTAFGAEPEASRLSTFERTLNGQPAVIAVQDGRVIAAILLAVADGEIRRVFLQNDPDRLAHLGLPS